MSLFNDRCWDNEFKVETPDFDGNLKVMILLIGYQPSNKKVKLVALNLKGRASARWISLPYHNKDKVRRKFLARKRCVKSFGKFVLMFIPILFIKGYKIVGRKQNC